MTALSVHALVIRSVDVGENDKLLTLLTEEKGRITASVKGSRSLKSRYFSSVQLCCYSQLILVRRNDRYYVKEAELSENFFAIRESIERTALAGYICEALAYVSVEEEADPALFRLSLNTLFAIAGGKEPLAKIKAVFEWRAMGILGFMPDLSACCECGATDGEFLLDVMNGNIICKKCRESGACVRELPEEDMREAHIVAVLDEGSRAAANYVLHCPADRILAFRLEPESMRLFGIAAETYFQNQVEHGFATLQFYKDITRMKP